MRQNYPVSSQEILTELKDLQETLISLIGYDSNSFDNSVEIDGTVGMLEDQLDTATTECIESRLYRKDNPEYSTIYRNAFVLLMVRRALYAK